MKGIIDTGAEYTLLSSYGARKVKSYEKIKRGTRDKVKGVAGVTRIAGYLTDHAIYINGV